MLLTGVIDKSSIDFLYSQHHLGGADAIGGADVVNEET